nr:hypothetical protein GCM10025732_51060 [Glycomyces mayteni]
MTTGIAVVAAGVGGFAVGALRPLGDASRWLLLPFAPWLFVGTGPLAAAHLEAVAGEGEWVAIGSFPPRAWIAIPLLFLFTALCWGLEDRRRAFVAQGRRGAPTGRSPRPRGPSRSWLRWRCSWSTCRTCSGRS